MTLAALDIGLDHADPLAAGHPRGLRSTSLSGVGGVGAGRGVCRQTPGFSKLAAIEPITLLVRAVVAAGMCKVDPRDKAVGAACDVGVAAARVVARPIVAVSAGLGLELPIRPAARSAHVAAGDDIPVNFVLTVCVWTTSESSR